MATYATTAELDAYLSQNSGANVRGDAEKLLQRAQRDVDRALGPYTLKASGLKLDPLTLTAAQVAALSRATCAAAEHRLVIGEKTLVGRDQFLPVQLQVVRQAGRTGPKILEELAGTGLVTWSGTVAA